jgi:hypothetical protein
VSLGRVMATDPGSNAGVIEFVSTGVKPKRRIDIAQAIATASNVTNANKAPEVRRIQSVRFSLPDLTRRRPEDACFF